MRYLLLVLMITPLLLRVSSAQLSPSAVEAVAFSPTEVRVYWNRLPGATRYVITRDGIEVGTAGAEAQIFADTRAAANHTYRYDVIAEGVKGERGLARPYLERTYPLLPDATDCDVLVVGATTAGVAAAVTASRYGLNVVLTEETPRLGGMPVNGLGATDLRRIAHSSGFFEEFRRHVQALYGSGDGLKYEPRIAHQAMKEIVWGETRLTVHRLLRPIKVTTREGRITQVVMEEKSTGRRVTFRSRLVVDATECGDVAAWAGAPFRVGREPRSRREPHAGHLFYDRKNDKALPGSTGRGDRRVQAYSYLMTVQDFGVGADKTIPRPPGYDKRKYEHAPKWEQSWAVTSGRLPNRKFEVNQHPHGSDLQGINYVYPTAGYAERQRVEQAYRDHALGYLYYIQTEEGKENIGLSEDDYRDTGNWPALLYIREARRFEADQILDETDIQTRPLRKNAIGLGDYPMDSHAVQPKTDWATEDMGEGEFYLPQYTPWHQVPYAIMLPKKLQNVFVPTAVSATHVAYGTLRLEPVRMHFGEAAGIAAYLCLRYAVTPRDVPARQIQAELLKRRPAEPARPAMDGIGAPGPNANPAFLYSLPDVPTTHRKYGAIQWLAARGFFPSSAPPPPDVKGPVAGLVANPFRPDVPISEAEAFQWLGLLKQRAVPGDRLPLAEDGKPVTNIPLTRTRGARLLARFLGWQLPAGERHAAHYEDVPFDHPDFDAVESLYTHWIDSRNWDDKAEYAPDGRLRFQPDRPLTRAQFAELIYLAHLYIGPLWEDLPSDKETG